MCVDRPHGHLRACRPFISLALVRVSARLSRKSVTMPHCDDFAKPRVAVVTRIAPRAPHRSRRALLTHRAPPSDSLPQDTDVESIQRIVLASSWPEPVGKPDEVLLVDRLQNRRDRLLDHLVLQTQNGKRPLRSVARRTAVRPLD